MRETIISRKELFNLPEYSCSLPTGKIVGKRWRRDINAYPFYEQDRKPNEQHEWWIGEYVEHPNPDLVGINWSWAVNENHEPHRGTEREISHA